MNDVFPEISPTAETGGAGFTAESFMESFPVALEMDEKIRGPGEAIAELLERAPKDIDLARIYPYVDRLPEPVLDILAYDFKIDWWEPDATIEQKRTILKDNWRIHRKLGTKSAVEWALSALYDKVDITEWFQYGGRPNCFRVEVEVDGETDRSTFREIWRRVLWVKRLSSWLDCITLRSPPVDVPVNVGVAGGAALGYAVLKEPELQYDGEIHAGIATGGCLGTITLPETDWLYGVLEPSDFDGIETADGSVIAVPLM